MPGTSGNVTRLRVQHVAVHCSFCLCEWTFPLHRPMRFAKAIARMKHVVDEGCPSCEKDSSDVVRMGRSPRLRP
jgi:hypothetical protein